MMFVITAAVSTVAVVQVDLASASTTAVVSGGTTVKTTEIDRIVSEGVHAGPFVIVVTLCVCFFLLSFS